MQTLQIYKASAGSGKTFTLAVEYIKLLVQNPENYRNILAVTFTNKATAEMKERILSQLYGIAHKLPDSQSYYEKIQKDLKLSEDVIRKNCEIALHNILHNFSYFHVETIDSFFQMIIRNLAHELNLSNNINLDLDQQGAINEAVDSLMESLTAESRTIQLILNYIQENIENDTNWNITQKLKKFGKNMFLEAYQNHASELKKGFEEDVFQKYKKKLQDTIREQLDFIKEFGESFMDSLAENGLTPDDLKQKGKGAAGYFQKLKEGIIGDDILNSYVKKALESADGWPGSDKSKKKQILELAENQWLKTINDAEEYRVKANKIVKTSQCILKNFNDLQLLSNIYTQFSIENQKNNRLLLAETPILLNRLIDDSDAPFLFEKIGTRLNHIMIDEFQDTSRLQWNNFKSLIVECMSKNQSNLIVGDLKQSIYRWREGDWSILKNIRQELPPIGEQKEIKLDTNRRSAGNIIAFNNDFFKKVSEAMDSQEQAEEMNPQIQQVYSDVKQEMTSGKEGKGFVKVTLINDKNDSRSEDYATENLKEIGDTIQELLAQGAQMQDIAILVRANKHIPEIASYFSENHPEIPIVSAEAFLLSSSQAVNTIINALRYLNDETDTLSAVLLAHQYQTQILHREMSWNDLCLAREKSELLPEEFLTKKDSLRLLPLYELIENLIQIFHLKELEQQDAYVFYFLDEVTEFLKDEPGDIVTFLNYWEETLKGKKIPAGKIQGVQVISIHKSKGLEFKHVIVPFCDWKMSLSGDILWIEAETNEEQKLPVIPVNFTGDLKESVFKETYQKELQQQWIDNVNLLYVAFTRPKANLFVIGKCPKKESLNTVSDLLYNFLDAPKEENADFIYTTGELYFPADKAETSENPLLMPSTETPVHLESSQPKIEFRQSNKSQQFLDRENGKQDAQEEFIEEGVILHNLFSTIRTMDDMEPQLQQLEFEGNVETKLTQKRIEQLVHKALQNPTAQDWFSGSWEVINECTILQHTPEGLKTLRPDRVMIRDGKVQVVDFKFGNPKEEHHEQVRNYMKLLLQMGYAQVEGCLWYVYKNHIEPVTLK